MGDADFPVSALGDDGDGADVVGAEDGRHAALKEPGHKPLCSFRDIVFQSHEVVVDLQPVFGQAREIGLIARLDDIRIQRAGDQPDFFVAQLHQVFDGLFKALLAAAPHRGHPGVVLDVVVVEDGGELRGAKFRHPGVQQRKAQHQRGLIALLEHEHVVGRLVLQLLVQGENIHVPAFGLRHLAKAVNDIIAKLVRRQIIHIFDDDAHMGVVPLELADIAHLRGGLQNLTLGCLADVGGVVQRLGNGAF